jgi:RHS repeat-associated protein
MRGSKWTYAYDFAGTLSADTLPGIAVHGISGTTRPVIRYSSPRSQVLVNTGSGSGTSSNPASRVVSSAIVATVTDPSNLTTSSTVNKFGLGLAVTTPRGKTTTYSYDGFFVNAIVLPDGDWQTFGYSGGRLAQSQKKGESVVSYWYGYKGELTRTFGYGHPTTYYYTDAQNGRVDSVRIGQNSPISMRYYYDDYLPPPDTTTPGTRRRLIRTKDAKGHESRFHYDATWSNIDSTFTDGNRVTTSSFDSFGRTVATKASGGPTSRVWYDSLNRVRKSHDGVLPDTTRLEYEGALLTGLRDPKQQLFKHEFNALGWMTKRFDAADTTKYEAFGYDVAGRVQSYTNRRNQAVTMAYDTWGRLESRTVGTEVSRFRYDSLDRVIMDSNAVLKKEIFRNGKSWVDSAVITILAINKRYKFHYLPDSLSRLVTTNVSSNTGNYFPVLTYTYSASRGLLETIAIDNQFTSFAHDDDRQISGRTWPSSLGYSTTQTSIHRPASVDYTGALSDVFSRRYGYDSLARIVEIQTRSGTNTYPTRFYYDSLGQIIGKLYGGQRTCSNPPDTTGGYGYRCMTDALSSPAFTYDLAGNRTDSSAVFTLGNRLSSRGGYTYLTDADGNITRKYVTGNPSDSVGYTWSPDGKLTKVTRQTGGVVDVVEYAYAATGELTQKKKNGTVVSYYLWERGQLFAELDSAGQRHAQYFYEPGIDRPLAVITGTQSYGIVTQYFVRDEVGNVIGMVSGSNVSQTTQYDEWGNKTHGINDNADINRLYWKGLIWEGDVAGLYYMRNRWYSPDVGRFISRDPVGLEGGLNGSVFGHNDPINYSDPDGLKPTLTYCGKNENGEDVYAVGSTSCEEYEGELTIGDETAGDAAARHMRLGVHIGNAGYRLNKNADGYVQGDPYFPNRYWAANVRHGGREYNIWVDRPRIRADGQAAWYRVVGNPVSNDGEQRWINGEVLFIYAYYFVNIYGLPVPIRIDYLFPWETKGPTRPLPNPRP